MNDKINLESQNERLALVIETITKQQNITQSKLLKILNIDITESQFSKFKSGENKKIPKELIRELHNKFGVNPDYFQMKTDIPFYTMEFQQRQFESLVSNYKVAKGKEMNCLLLNMDERFYEYLLEYEKIKSVDESIIEFDKAKSDLQNLYSSFEKENAEYVLIPRKYLKEIVQSDMNNIDIEAILNLDEIEDCIDK